MSSMQAVIVDPDAPGRLTICGVEQQIPSPSQALIKVAAVSLNRGELRRAGVAAPGTRIGWDLAGTVEQAAADSSGPQAGARVVGFLPSGSWAEYAAVPTNALAELPPKVNFAQAATLPVAGLTALYALDKGNGLIGKRVLVTGASGGAGHFAVQLARLSGAHVVGLIRQTKYEDLIREAGAHDVVVSEDGAAAASYGPYNLIVDAVGGQVLGNAMSMLAPGGVAVSYGATMATETSFSTSRFYLTGGATLHGFFLFYEVTSQPASLGLKRLADLIPGGALRPYIEVETSWKDVGAVAQRLINREFAGKAVLYID